MQQTISMNISPVELSRLISDAVGTAIDTKLQPSDSDTLFTVGQATEYMQCSDVFLWKLRRDGKIMSTNAGKKILIPKSSIDRYLNLKGCK